MKASFAFGLMHFRFMFSRLWSIFPLLFLLTTLGSAGEKKKSLWYWTDELGCRPFVVNGQRSDIDNLLTNVPECGIVDSKNGFHIVLCKGDLNRLLFFGESSGHCSKIERGTKALGNKLDAVRKRSQD